MLLMLLKSTTTGLLLVSTTLSLIEIRKRGFLPQRHIETAARELQDANRQLNRNRKGPRALRRSAVFLVSHWHKRPPGPRKTRAENEKEGASSCGLRPARIDACVGQKGTPAPARLGRFPASKKKKTQERKNPPQEKENKPFFLIIIMKEEALRALQRPLSSHF